MGLNDEKMIGFDSDQLSELLSENFGLCLDVNHAMKAAISLGIDGVDFVRQLGEFSPTMLHISDGHMNQEKDMEVHYWPKELKLALKNMI